MQTKKTSKTSIQRPKEPPSSNQLNAIPVFKTKYKSKTGRRFKLSPIERFLKIRNLLIWSAAINESTKRIFHIKLQHYQAKYLVSPSP